MSTTATIDLRVGDGGTVTAIFDDAVDFRRLAQALGPLSIRRASHVEPTVGARWTADMSPVGGPVLGPFDSRSEALAQEVAWLRRHLGFEDTGRESGIQEVA